MAEYTDWVTLDTVVKTESRTQDSHISTFTEGFDGIIPISGGMDASVINAEWNTHLDPIGATSPGSTAGNILSAVATRRDDPDGSVDDLGIDMASVQTDMFVNLPERGFTEADYEHLAPAEHAGIEIENGGIGAWVSGEVQVSDYNWSFDGSADVVTPLFGSWTYVHSIGSHSIGIAGGGGVPMDGALAGSGTITIPGADMPELGVEVTLTSVFAGDFDILLNEPAFEIVAIVRASCRPTVTQVSATITPPRARWLLPTATAEPSVTRQWPRDDALGSMGSGTRIYPPPRRGRVYPAQQ